MQPPVWKESGDVLSSTLEQRQTAHSTQRRESQAPQGRYNWVPAAHSAHTASGLLDRIWGQGEAGEPTPCSSATGLSSSYGSCCTECQQELETTSTGQAAHTALPAWQPWFPSDSSAAALWHCCWCHRTTGCKMHRLRGGDSQLASAHVNHVSAPPMTVLSCRLLETGKKMIQKCILAKQ